MKYNTSSVMDTVAAFLAAECVGEGKLLSGVSRLGTSEFKTPDILVTKVNGEQLILKLAKPAKPKSEAKPSKK